MKRRVLVTGMGVVSPVGNGWRNFWHALVHGRSGVRPISRFDASTLAVRIAAEVRGFDLSRYSPVPHYYTADDGQTITLDRRTQYALAAAEMAVREAKLGPADLSHAHLYFGAGQGADRIDWLAQIIAPYSCPQGCDTRALLSAVRDPAFALYDQLLEPTLPASLIAARFGIQGEVTTCLTACAASAQAIGEGACRIRDGECDVVLVGGAHAMTAPLDIIGFASLSALSTRNEEPQRASRPFDLGRDGFVLGEGAAVLVLEESAHARRRGARAHAEIVGYGLANDAYRVTDMHPEARGPVTAMLAALDEAALEPTAIDYINAHGTSTIENDRTETLAVHRVFGDHARRLSISSTKSMTGHLVAAAGAVELVATVLTIETQTLPPTINLEEPDPECDLDYVPNRARRSPVQFAMSNSFGFGGQNVALVVGRAEG
ncbi:MAG: beta-ketoacyl-[acyl-carrier-protein] synthase II [Pyrinomonas sp.]|uniref:beta-ketoacyl-[acyl-carrier-protein] synthase family protein n=1 Tax=Pyrinomonas sp. TaxID=2080306 RepID=UPI00332E687B